MKMNYRIVEKERNEFYRYECLENLPISEDTKCGIFIVDSKDELIGFIILKDNHFIEYLFIEPEYRGLGLAQEILNRFCRKYKFSAKVCKSNIKMVHIFKKLDFDLLELDDDKYLVVKN